jgi:TPR repeat protein
MTEEHKRCRLALDRVADEWLCPITHELPLDPVMAEDSRFYERASIEEWLMRNRSSVRSPVTNAPMGRILKSAPQVLITTRSLVESGAIAGDAADSWKMRLAQEEEVRLMRQRASAGEVAAMLALGLWYLFGEKGLKKDDAQAFPWLKLAAHAGDVKAMANVGWMYCHDSGVPINVHRGAARLGQAAALGSE